MTNKKNSGGSEGWRTVCPVPADVALPTFRHSHYQPSDIVDKSVYVLDGELLGYVVRFRSSSGEAKALPYTWCQSEQDGNFKWCQKQWDEPRPLFLAGGEMPGQRTVVLVGDEPTAGLLQQALDEALEGFYSVVTWPGGGKTWRKADWSWLKGCRVLLWPASDAEHAPLNRTERAAMTSDLGRAVLQQEKPMLPLRRQPSYLVMRAVGEHLQAQLECKVAMLQIPEPGSVKHGWGAANAVLEWPGERLLNFLGSAQPLLDAAEAGSTPTIAAAGDGGGRGAMKAEARRWQDCLLLTEKGLVKAVRENVVIALDGIPADGIDGCGDMAGLIRFNEFTNNVEKTRDTPWGTSAGVWEEHDELLMGEWLVRTQFLPSMPRTALEEAVVMVSRRNAYHPVRERMLALQGRWDGRRRLPMWLQRVCMAEGALGPDDEDLRQYLARAGTWFIRAMVARVLPLEKSGSHILRGPGTKFDYMLVLEGIQGAGKTTFAETLGGDHFANTGLTLGDKDSYQNIQGVWIYEWAELDGLARADLTRVKSFISSAKDRFRASFDRRPKDYPRQVVFVGTTNERHYLSDPTGNRRFWPVACTRDLDIAWLRENVEQLLAEALHDLGNGARFWPTREEQRELFDPQQQVRVLQNPLESAIRRYLYDEDQKVPQFGENGALLQRITLSDLLTAIGYTVDKQTPAVAKQVAAVMHALGWELKRASKGMGGGEDKARPYHYHRPKPAPAPGSAQATSSSPGTQGESPKRPDDEPPF
ncbi:conjugal transfer protein TraC [Hylemonella gracilis str. Niagara R]|uniref:Conjugal transfer protein TraC n=1 Tax=Hylemonella gracilis str. Niagara R TaxID=1458275 RepID=A0A016XJH4_9BURK|nr:virulence-associated E family protein [Hylemonella gracilis]EYC51712.1 conjugal transfer protein TraC [Hylemonella gracilis str. Niagara R]